LLFGLQLRQPLQSLLDPLGALARGSFTGFLLPAVLGPWVLVQLVPQCLNLRLGLCVSFLQGRTTAKRRSPGAGTDAHPVLGHSVQVDQSFGDQHCDVVSQQRVEQLDMPGTEVGERVVVGAHIAGDPAESIVCAAQFVELTGATDSFEGGVKPERHEDLGVDGGTSRRPLDGLDAVVQRAEVEPFDIVPDYPRGMIERDQFIEGRSAKDDLLAVSGPQPRASRGGWSLGWRGLACRIGRCLEERGPLEARRLGIVWVFHEDIIAVGSSLDNTFGIIGDSFTGSERFPGWKLHPLKTNTFSRRTLGLTPSASTKDPGDAPRTGSAGAWPNLCGVVAAGVQPAQPALLFYLRGVI